MARARNIKPQFFLNDELAELDPLARLLFIGLWCIADREGRLEDRPKRIKAETLPYDDCDVDALLDVLENAGFIVRYRIGDAAYIQVTNFGKHQNPHIKEAASTIPAPCEHQTSTVQAPEEHRSSPADSLNLIPDTGLLDPDSLAPAARQPGRDEIFESVATVCYGPDWQNITDDERGRTNRAVAQLKKIHATPQDIYGRADEYHRRYDMPLTPQSLTKCWTDLGQARSPRASPVPLRNKHGGLTAAGILAMNQQDDGFIEVEGRVQR